MSKKKKTALVPKLRFPEFRVSGEWVKCRLGEIADRITEKVGNKKLTTLSISVGIGFVSQAEKFSRDISGKQYDNYVVLKKGDFSYNKGNSKKFPQGCVYKLTEYKKAAVPNAFISFHFHDDYVSDFYKGYFASNFHGRQLNKFITSGARSDGLLNINADDFFSIILPTPKENKEQQKIADCLSSFDDLILTEKQKLEFLKSHKKGLMQQLFPAEGKRVPKLRFPEYTGAWEQRKLSDMTIYMNGKGYEDKQSNTGKYEPINLNSISIDGGLKHSGKFVDEITDTLNRNDLVMVLSDIGHGDLLGRVAIIPENDRFVLNQRVALLRPNNSATSQFLFSYINAHQSYFKAQGTGMSQLNISKGSVENFTSYVPKISEQKQIGQLFAGLDRLITLHQHKLKALDIHKKGLLQGLFPAVEDVLE